MNNLADVIGKNGIHETLCYYHAGLNYIVSNRENGPSKSLAAVHLKNDVIGLLVSIYFCFYYKYHNIHNITPSLKFII